MDVPLPTVLRAIAFRYGWLIVLLIVLGGGAAAGYALMTPRQWMAYQSLSVRDELIGTAQRPGRFDSADQLRAAQETVRSVARNKTVIATVLAQLDPPPTYNAEVWPDAEYVEDYGGKVSVTAANGAEFGQTEILVLSVRESSPERAAQVVAYLTQQLADELATLRDLRFGSMESELESGMLVAQEAVDQASRELSAFERELGADLSELRSMNDAGSSEGPVRRQLGAIRQDMNVATQRLGDLKTQLTYLQELVANPAAIVSTPESIMTLHPDLRRLKEGIIDATVRVSDLKARYDDTHPLVLAAASSSQSLAAELRLQLDSAVKGTEFERDVVQSRVEDLKMQEATLVSRIAELAAKRVDYSDIVHRVERRKIELARIESELTEVKASREAATQAAVISPIGPPRADSRPVGPGRTTVAAAGAAGGLVLAIGIIAVLFDPRALAASLVVDEAPRRYAGSPSREATVRPRPRACPGERRQTSRSRFRQDDPSPRYRLAERRFRLVLPRRPSPRRQLRARARADHGSFGRRRACDDRGGTRTLARDRTAHQRSQRSEGRDQ
ncbi:MAG: hypothetical protein R3B96_21855 [Pirellulaceae bacterium]